MTNRTKLAALLVGLLVVLIVPYWTGELGQTVGDRPLPTTTKVVIFGIPNLGLMDMTPEAMPNLSRIADQGVRGAMTVQTGGEHPNAAEAYATLGAGATVGTGSAGITVFNADETSQGLNVLESQRLLSGKALSGSVVVPGMLSMVANSAPRFNAVGRLGQELRDAGHPTALVANSNFPVQQRDKITRATPSGLAIADRDGMIAYGSAAVDLLRPEPLVPFGVTMDADRFQRAVNDALAKADVVVADPGETTRASKYLSTQTPAQGSRSRKAALARTDALLGTLKKSLPAHTLLIVAGITPAGGQWALTPVVISGQGVTPGRLDSPSTHRPGIITLTDIAPTVLGTLGVTPPEDMRGAVLRQSTGGTSWDTLRDLDRILDARIRLIAPMTVLFVVVQAVLYLVALLKLNWGKRTPALQAALETVALTCASWPLATLILRLSIWASAQYWTSVAISWLIAAAIGISAQRLRRSPLDPLLAICGATMAVIAIDVATGAHLIFGSFYGYAPNTGGRYFGIGNPMFATLAASTVVVCGAIIDRTNAKPTEAKHTNALWWAAAIAGITIIVDGAPWMGADVGGILTLVPVFGLMLWALSGRRIDRRFVVFALAAGAVGLALAVVADALRPADQRTHIGRFFLSAANGDGHFLVDTFADKWDRSMAAFSATIWAWAVPAIVLFCLWILVIAKGWTRLLPYGSARRITVIAGLALGVLGWLVNDSGIVVTALVLVYLCPMLLLISLRCDPMANPADPNDGAVSPESPTKSPDDAAHPIVASHAAEHSAVLEPL